MEKINVAEILRDCPRGLELYSPLCGKCVFDRLNMGTIICKKQNTQEITFTSEGYYMIPVFDNCECMIFPSKDQRDWSKFRRPFKNGDIVIDTLGNIAIIKAPSEGKYITHITKSGNILISDTMIYASQLATKEKKEELFQAIKKAGYKWNTETKTLEELPKFKIGDRIKNKDNCHSSIVVEIRDDCFIIKTLDGFHHSYLTDKLPFSRQAEYELVTDKFNINTLKPFDKVLVRGNVGQKWIHDFFGFMDNDKGFPFVCVSHYVIQCIPYEGNEHLLGTTNDCDSYFKTWE